MRHSHELICSSCRQSRPEKAFSLRCPDCGAPLEIDCDLEEIRRNLKRGWPKPNGKTLLKQWEGLLPLSHPELIARCSLGETQTPLIRSNKMGLQLGLNDLRFKVEIGPTLSLKDRGSALCSLKALELGFEAMCVASSGNNASSVAAYAARAGLPAVVFVQRVVAAAKFAKMLSYGAKVVRIDGDLNQAGRMCSRMLESHRWMESGGPNPYRIAAKRLVAYEIVAQMEGEVPDAVLFPCGGCAGIVAAHSGFSELMEMGLIRQMPRLIGVQLAACDPVTQAFEKDRSDVTPMVIKPTISDALTNNNPYWGARAIAAARQTGGFFISVTDEDVTMTAAEIASAEGLYLEPAGAAAMAGLSRAMNENRMARLNRVVCTVTGHGLNARQPSTRGRNGPEPIAPDPAVIAAYLDG